MVLFNLLPAPKFLTLGVLAGAYAGNGLSKSLLTHCVEDHGCGGWRALCGRVKADNICDYSTMPDSVPTREHCAKLDPRTA